MTMSGGKVFDVSADDLSIFYYDANELIRHISSGETLHSHEVYVMMMVVMMYSIRFARRDMTIIQIGQVSGHYLPVLTDRDVLLVDLNTNRVQRYVP